MKKHLKCDICDNEVEMLYNVSVCDADKGDHELSNIIAFDVCESCIRHNELYDLIETMKDKLKELTKGGFKNATGKI